jgi:signal transduction histidine kinase/ActR/RegA family two-component response regulator
MPHFVTASDRPRQKRFLGLILTHRLILATYLGLVGLISLVYWVFPAGAYDTRVNLAVTALSWVMLLLGSRVERWHPVMVHTTTALAVILTLHIAWHTGGLNSGAMVWLGVLSVPVLLMLGSRAAFIWIGINLLCVLGMLMASRAIGPVPLPQDMNTILVQTLVNHLLALSSLMLGVFAGENLHTNQLWDVENRNRELRDIHDALMQAQAHKDEFTAAVGHELRTPMNAILGFNSVLRQELADRPEQAEVVEHIRHSTTHLLQVVNDILDFSQLQAGQLQLAPADVDLRQLLEEAMVVPHRLAAEKGLRCELLLHPDMPAHVHVDRQRLLQILGNLLGNAIKFTDRGQVVLRVMPALPRWRFEVEDTGRGIAPEQQAHVFRQFEHADVQTNRAYGGTGLGLTICERLVNIQGGEIGVRSSVGQGSVFWFELPLEEVSPDHPAAAPVQALPVSEPLRILLVDDNTVNLMVAQLQLQKIWPKARITQCTDGAQALRSLETQSFDVALIDMVMPEMDGMQLTGQIRRYFPAQTALMPILALTANTQAQERQKCLDAGMDDVLHKPMDTAQVVASVSLHVRRARGLST